MKKYLEEIEDKILNFDFIELLIDIKDECKLFWEELGETLFFNLSLIIMVCILLIMVI